MSGLGLLVQLAIVHAADVIFLLGDVLLLSFPGLELVLVALTPQTRVGLIVAGIRRQPAGVELKHLGDDTVQEIPIVADDEHRLLLFDEIVFQPARGVDVEVIAGLVQEHDVRGGQQQLGEHEPALLTAAEGLDGSDGNPRR